MPQNLGFVLTTKINRETFPPVFSGSFREVSQKFKLIAWQPEKIFYREEQENNKVFVEFGFHIAEKNGQQEENTM